MDKFTRKDRKKISLIVKDIFRQPYADHDYCLRLLIANENILTVPVVARQRKPRYRYFVQCLRKNYISKFKL